MQWEVPPTRRLAFVVVLALAASCVPVTVVIGFRPGAYVLAGALLLAGVIRAALPEKYCLGLLIRSRQLDVLFDVLLGLGVLITAWSVPL